MHLKYVALFACCSPFFCPLLLQASSTSFFALEPSGSAHALGLSGATVAMPDDPEIAKGNPASMVWGQSVFNLGAQSHSYAQSPPLENTLGKFPSEGTVYQASFHPVSSFALGGGHSASKRKYESLLSSDREQKLRIDGREWIVALSARPLERMSLGFAVNFKEVGYRREVGFAQGSLTMGDEDRFVGRSYKAGLIYALFETLSLGFSVETPEKLNNEQTASSIEGGVDSSLVQQRAQDARDPLKVKLGSCYLLLGDLNSTSPLENTFFLQIDFFSWAFSGVSQLYHPTVMLFDENESVPFRTPEAGTQAAASSEESRYILGLAAVPRLGIQTTWFRWENFHFSTSLGSWYEPKYISGLDPAVHTSIGAAVNLWRVSLSAAADFARENVRPVFGVGVSF